jgi:hypothetical protein
MGNLIWAGRGWRCGSACRPASGGAHGGWRRKQNRGVFYRPKGIVNELAREWMSFSKLGAKSQQRRWLFSGARAGAAGGRTARAACVAARRVLRRVEAVHPSWGRGNRRQPTAAGTAVPLFQRRKEEEGQVGMVLQFSKFPGVKLKSKIFH